MPLIIFLLILAVPVVELAVLIDIGEEIGALPTVALCILTAAVGLSIVKRQGMRVFQDMQAASQDGGALGASLVHGFFLAIAGVFLFIPGFMTDLVGALLLIPPVRMALGKLGLAQFVVHRGGSRPHETIIIEGEYREEGPEEDPDQARLNKKDDPDNQ